MKNLNQSAPFTRLQYLNGDCSHSDYYSQFVTPSLRESVKNWIGEKDIMNSQNEHFNDIPLARWDGFQQVVASIPFGISAKMKELGDSLTLAGTVCIAKEAARQIKNG